MNDEKRRRRTSIVTGETKVHHYAIPLALYFGTVRQVGGPPGSVATMSAISENSVVQYRPHSSSVRKLAHGHLFAQARCAWEHMGTRHAWNKDRATVTYVFCYLHNSLCSGRSEGAALFVGYSIYVVYWLRIDCLLTCKYGGLGLG